MIGWKPCAWLCQSGSSPKRRRRRGSSSISEFVDDFRRMAARGAASTVLARGGYGRGTPIRAPVVEIDKVGAGGGSIAWIDGQNRLNVGPKSAGSQPGPVASRGGTEPTVSDANLVFGRFAPARFQGGEMRLDAAAAHRRRQLDVNVPTRWRSSAFPCLMGASLVESRKSAAWSPVRSAPS